MELIVRHKDNLRGYVFAIEKNERQKVFFNDDTTGILKTGNILYVPSNGNENEVELTMDDAGRLNIKHRSWSAAYILPLPEYWD